MLFCSILDSWINEVDNTQHYYYTNLTTSRRSNKDSGAGMMLKVYCIFFCKFVCLLNIFFILFFFYYFQLNCSSLISYDSTHIHSICICFRILNYKLKEILIVTNNFSKLLTFYTIKA